MSHLIHNVEDMLTIIIDLTFGLESQGAFNVFKVSLRDFQFADYYLCLYFKKCKDFLCKANLQVCYSNQTKQSCLFSTKELDPSSQVVH